MVTCWMLDILAANMITGKLHIAHNARYKKKMLDLGMIMYTEMLITDQDFKHRVTTKLTEMLESAVSRTFNFKRRKSS